LLRLVEYIIRLVFSTAGVTPKELQMKACRNLSNLIIDQNMFQYSVHGARNFLCGIPLLNAQGVFGAMVSFGPNPYTSYLNETKDAVAAYHADEMESFLSNLTTLVEESLDAKEEVVEMAQELDQSLEDLYLYGKIATQIKTLRFSGSMLTDLIQELLENMRADAAFAWLPDSNQSDVQVVTTEFDNRLLASKNFFKELIAMIPPDAPTIAENYFILNDSRNDAQYKDLAKAPYRFLAVRVQHREVYYGWLGLVSFNFREMFRHSELKLLISLAEQLAGVVANTDLYKDLERFVINMVKSLVFAIEAKDVYTRGHSERVSKYSMLIGAQFGLSDKEYNDLKWASILHDIGKIGIPEIILNKPGRLTDAEYAIIKEHPAKGAEILKPVEQLADSLPSIIYHHERYDGQGYPRGLKGEEIPLGARIIGVADTFDAINSSRAYRSPQSAQKAMTIIEEVAGSQLDPRIVKVFKQIYQEYLLIEEK